MKIDFNATLNNEDVKGFLKDFHDKIKKSKKADAGYVTTLAALVFEDIDKHFLDEEGPDGKWAPWSKSYLETIQGKAFYRRVGGKTIRFDTAGMKKKPPKPPRSMGKILQATGRLRGNFKPTQWRASSGGILWFNDAKTRKGFSYAGAHDVGGDKLPARPFMWLSDKAIEKIEDQTLAYVLEKGG